MQREGDTGAPLFVFPLYHANMGNLRSGYMASDEELTGTPTSGVPIPVGPAQVMALTGTTLCEGRFEIGGILGKGGQGAVFRVIRHAVARSALSTAGLP